MGIATHSWEWLGDFECGSEEGEAFVLALTYSIDHFKGRLYQARLDKEIPNEASSSDEAQGFEISSSGGPIGEFEGSAGLFGGGVVGVSTLRMGTRILSHIEIKVGEYYSGRLYLFDFDGSSPIEIKLQRGRTKSRRGLGDSPFFGKRFVSMPVPWDWIKDEEPSSKELKGKEQASFEHTTDWFSCSEIRDCTSALDSCGLLRGVRRDAEALYSSWVENEHEGDCFSQAPDHDGLQLHLPSRPAPECIPAVGCFEGRCEVRFFKEGEERCEF